MNKVDVLLGLQWGDEGKGKVVDVLAPGYDIIARFQGGPNAGHTLVFQGEKYVLHTIPSGIFREGIMNFIGQGVVLDPVVFSKEISKIAGKVNDLDKRLLIARGVHLILPTHRLLDAASETSKGKAKIGSTLKGIGPAYMDKTGRNGFRIGDLESGHWREKYEHLKNKHLELLSHFKVKIDFDMEELEEEFFRSLDDLRKIKFVDGVDFMQSSLAEGKKILAEGAQGTLLDINFGTYPYVTSSTTTAAGACIGLGVSPAQIGKVVGITKAYTTRVGSGPFPTELFDDYGRYLAEKGYEFGATTGRPRRCGWLDLAALNYAVKINGVDELCLMKADVLSGMKEVKVATAYRMGDQEMQGMPFDLSDERVTPVYKNMTPWSEDLTGVTGGDHLPDALLQYIDFIENYTGVKVRILSVGPDRKQTIWR